MIPELKAALLSIPQIGRQLRELTEKTTIGGIDPVLYLAAEIKELTFTIAKMGTEEIKKRVEAEAQLAKLESKIHRFRRNTRKRKKRA